jgi:hypothetical protein
VTGQSVPYAFYLPEDPAYTIVQSALDTVRFLLHVSDRDEADERFCRSIDAISDGQLIRYRGRFMEGVGYCADSIFGAHLLVRLGRITERPEFEAAGFSYLDHALAAGFFDDPALPVKLYRDTETGKLLDNLEDHDGYLEPGHIARVGTHLLRLAELDTDVARGARCREIAARTAALLMGIDRCDNGWYPRRCTPDGRVMPFAANAFGPTDLAELTRIDPIHDRSGAGVLALQLLAGVTRAGVHDASAVLREDVDAFVRAGGCFGSTNTDTEDLHENVSYALAFQALLEASDALGDPALRAFAYERCLEPLTGFELKQDLNGVATKGLLFMEESWNAACTWEMAEAAQAYLVAFDDGGHPPHVLKALTILRGMAMHHHGPHGFLTEAVDWDGHSTPLRHFPGERYGDIVTTHPFLNNLHVLQPTVTYLERFAVRMDEGDGPGFYDLEGNRLCDIPLPAQGWMHA